MAYCVVRTDLMSGTVNPAYLENGRYYNAGGTFEAIQNGSIVHVGALETDQRESHKYLDVTADSKIDDLVLIADEELIYSESDRKNLRDYINEAGKCIRGYYMRPNNEFSVTADGISGVAPTVGQKLVVAKNSHILKVGTSSDGVVIGTCTAIETKFQFGTTVTYYTIKVGK